MLKRQPEVFSTAIKDMKDVCIPTAQTLCNIYGFKNKKYLI
jgi:hypothetical protein